mmetsp:Transcript_15650/g.44731  ORF Transcript_15650/g.44731 Transcript_15650/m.44731 type:complete len:834 (+) Transcript_15650:2609-5110(+)
MSTSAADAVRRCCAFVPFFCFLAGLLPPLAAAAAAPAAAAAAAGAAAAAASGGSKPAKKQKKGTKAQQRRTASAADVDMEDVFEKTPDDALEALDGVAKKLQTHLKRVEEAKAKAQQLYQAKNGLLSPDSETTNSRIQDLDRQFRVWTSMVMRDAREEVDHIDTSAKKHLDENFAKLRIIQHKMNRLNQDTTDCSLLEDLPEALWVSTEERIGVGGHLGFAACMQSLARVNTQFKDLCDNSNMHPILELKKPPPDTIIDQWSVKLSACQRLSIDHRPTPAIVRLLEALAPSLQVVDLRGRATQYEDAMGDLFRRSRKQKKWERLRDMELFSKKVGEERAESILPVSKAPVVFPKLRRATVRSRPWGEIPHKRAYQLPVLRALRLGGTHDGAPWVRQATGGLHSLHLLCDAAEYRLEESLSAVGTCVSGTESPATLTSLTGRLTLGATVHGLLEMMSSPGGVGGQGGRLRHIQMGVRSGIRDTAIVDKLHRFRTHCLAQNATEDYFDSITYGRPREYQQQQQQEDEEPTFRPLQVSLPLVENNGMASFVAAMPTFQLCCRRAGSVTLKSHCGSTDVTSAPGIDSLVFETADELAIEPCYHAIYLTTAASTAYLTLPSYITSRPAALFPSVTKLHAKVVSGHNVNRMAVYQGGVDRVMGGLHALERASFDGHLRTPRTSWGVEAHAGGAKVGLVPEGAKYLDSDLQGHPLTIVHTYRYCEDSRVEVGVYETGEEGKALLQKRIAHLELHYAEEMGHRYFGRRRGADRTADQKAMYSSLVEAVAQAFNTSKVLETVFFDHTPKPTWAAVSHTRSAAKKRFQVASEKSKALLFTRRK